MWFEERSWSNLRVSELVEEWRDLWPHKLEFMVAVISYVFATTNFLNLPRLILDNGGVAFVAAYGSVLLTLVLPVVVLELAIGQLTGRAPVAAFYNLSPAFKGIGVSQILFTMLVLACMTRFLAILGLYAYNLFFTLYQGRTGLPWLNCQGFPEIISQPCREAGSLANFTSGASTKMSAIRGESTLMQFMAHYENPSQSIDDFGEFQYWLLGAQGIIWGLVFLSVFYGVRWVGKVISFNMLFAFCFFVGLVVRALTLGGLMDILDVYWKATDWNKLADYQVWKIAVEQAILASGIGFGALITIGSYNKRHNNLVCDSILIVFFHAIFTIMQVAFVIGIVGFVSMKTGLQPGELLEKGEAQMWHIFAYLSYVPQTKLITGAVLIASILILLNIFYLLTLSLLSTMEDALGDRWSRCCYRFILAFFLCGLMMAMSLYFATQAGRHAYDLVTGFLKYITIFVILTFELFAAAWFYCAWTLGTDLRTMLRNACSKCLGQTILLLTYLLPFVPAVVAVLNAMSYDFASFSPAIHHWEWSEYVGAACAVVPLLPIPLYFLATLTKACCCRDKHGHSRGQRIKLAVSSRLRRDKEKAAPPPRYTGSAPGYLLLPQAPLAEPETYA